MITLNHIDAMLDFTTNQAVKQNINAAYELLIQVKSEITTIIGLDIFTHGIIID